MKMLSLCLFVLVGFVGVAQASDDDARLVSQLLDSPSDMTLVRPAKNQSTALSVKVAVDLLGIDKIEDLTRYESKITASVYVKMVWDDYRMMWDPSDFGGISAIRLPIEKLWKPDIALFYNMDLGLQLDTSALALVSSSGGITWFPSGKFSVKAIRDNSPGRKYDWSVWFNVGSWTHDASLLDLGFLDNRPEMIMDMYVPSAYELVNNTAREFERYYPCCQWPYEELQYHLLIKELD